MTRSRYCFSFVVICVIFDLAVLEDSDSCFCQLRGELDDCSCTVESIDSFNNLKINPRLTTLLQKPYFRYYKANLFRKCPFDSDNTGQCGSPSCAVDECKEKEIPEGLRDKNRSHEKNKYAEDSQKETKCEENKLGNLDTHISDESRDAFAKWKTHDDAQDNFCELDDEDSPQAVYYDLIRNPERFTGYTGPSAVNVWKLIYDQNCFKPDKPDYSSFLKAQQAAFKCGGNVTYPQRDSHLEGMCLEKRVFYRMISGFHTSINMDVTANWLLPARDPWGQPQWGPNLEEFQKRFLPEYTQGEGPRRLKNMYFTYLVELRALAKVAPYLQKEWFYTGNKHEDQEVREMMKDLLEIIKDFPFHFDESKLFKGDAKRLKEDFKLHFRNISRIMDCVGCDKCRLWGKLQITGMGTALKILFSGDSMAPDSTVTQQHKKADIPFQLTRNEIVALINAFGRISKSIHEVDNFRIMATT